MTPLNLPITALKGIGTRRAKAFSDVGISLVSDLLNYYPIEYADFSAGVSLVSLKKGDKAALAVTVLTEPKTLKSKSGLNITTVDALYDNERIRLLWFNRQYAGKELHISKTAFVYGTFDNTKYRALINPRIFKNFLPIVPIYKKIKDIPPSVIENATMEALSLLSDNSYTDPLSTEFLKEFDLMPLNLTYRNIHFPLSRNELNAALMRFSFSDILIYRIMIGKLKKSRAINSTGIAFDASGILDSLKAKLTFELTESQIEAIMDIKRDMERSVPMNRMLYGDVGSGKTVVAAFAMAVAVKNGFQALLMAPTDILTRQHFETLSVLFKDETTLLTGSLKKVEREIALRKIANGDAKYIIGTHALIQDAVSYKNLGLVITDEQHRFGVKQRADLKNKANAPDVLVMSATPIPRTLALILYGDLDISRMDELPKNRKPIMTRCVPPHKRLDMYEFIKQQIILGYSAYIVCPHIEEGENDSFFLSAKSVYREMQSVFDFPVGLLHSRMKQGEKERAMADFLEGKTPVLVSTTVVEVGVDAKNASVMVIESADMFGLAQLHQLRGRVGRSDMQAYCFLMSDGKNDRLTLMTREQSGIKLAEADLKLRGAGEFLGSEQHGNFLLFDTVGEETLKAIRRALMRLMRGEFKNDFEYFSLMADIKYGKLAKEVVMN
ncbi:MAG: ATP-dependent DNA helicase RecG [Clostridia bacterium]